MTCKRCTSFIEIKKAFISIDATERDTKAEYFCSEHCYRRLREYQSVELIYAPNVPVSEDGSFVSENNLSRNS